MASMSVAPLITCERDIPRLISDGSLPDTTFGLTMADWPVDLPHIFWGEYVFAFWNRFNDRCSRKIGRNRFVLMRYEEWGCAGDPCTQCLPDLKCPDYAWIHATPYSNHYGCVDLVDDIPVYRTKRDALDALAKYGLPGFIVVPINDCLDGKMEKYQ